MPEQSFISVQDLGLGIVRVGLDDPAHDNRLRPAFTGALNTALERVTEEPDTKVIVIAGTPKVFCAGAELAVLERLSQGEPPRADLELAHRLLHVRVPVVAALEGHAIGGGLTLALCCDVAVAAETSRYGFNFTDLGFTPGLATTTLLPLATGPSFAAEMLLTAKLYKGRELAGSRLFSQVVPKANVASTALDIARRIAEKPELVINMLKDTLALPKRRAFVEGVPHELLMHRARFAEPGALERIEQTYLT